MSVQRRRRWLNFNLAVDQRVVFSGIYQIHPSSSLAAEMRYIFNKVIQEQNCTVKHITPEIKDVSGFRVIM